MKNIEKYRDKILKVEENGAPDSNFCNNFIEPIILKQYGLECKNMGCGQCNLISLVWVLEKYKEPERPELTPEELEQLPVDTLLEVWGDEEVRTLRYFEKYENGKIYCWSYGATSKTAYDKTMSWPWDHARLAE